MNEQAFFNSILIFWFALAVIIFISLLFVVAPYGRHIRKDWGPTLDNKLGWVIMEASSPLVFMACFALGSNPTTFTSLCFFFLWEAHYIHRAFIYPFKIKGSAKRMSATVMSMGLLFNLGNAYLNGRYIFTFSHGYADQWLADPRFIIGVGVFIIGFIINRQADRTLRDLREYGESGYRIPYGKLYRWISCPNYLGEILIWTGWAIATWSLPGLAFAIWTAANLVPRARAHHAWYHKRFQDYPTERKALVPRVW